GSLTSEAARGPAERGPRPLHLGVAEAARAAHDLHHIEEPEVGQGRLVIAPADARLGDRAGMEEVVPDDVVGPRVAGFLDGRAAATAAPRGRLVALDLPPPPGQPALFCREEAACAATIFHPGERGGLLPAP